MQIWWEEDQYSNSCFLAFALHSYRDVRRNVIFGHMYRRATLDLLSNWSRPARKALGS